ncbi:MAG TPA: hypothetical protein VGE07_29275 [Herpetosiphonaceae bacterium]
MGIKIKLSGLDQRALIMTAMQLRALFGERLELDEPVQLGQFDPVFTVYGELAPGGFPSGRNLPLEAEADLAIDELYGWLGEEPDLERGAFGFDVMEALLRNADVRYNREAERAEWLFRHGVGTWVAWLNITRTVWIIGLPGGGTARVRHGKLYESVFNLISSALSAD